MCTNEPGTGNATMAAQARRKPLTEVLTGGCRRPPPVWLMRQAGRYLPEYRELRAGVNGFLELCFTPALAAEVTLQPVRRYGLDAAILFSDILVVPAALGQPVTFVEGEGPRLDPVADAAGLGRLSPARLHDVLAPVYETVDRVKGALSPETALIGFAGAPWTVACYMVEGGGSKDFAAVRTFAFADPAGFARLVELLVDTTAAYLVRQIAAGAETVQLFDSWAGVLPEAAFRRWVIAPTREIVARVKARAPGVPVIGFPRGAGVLYEAYAAETGVDAVGLDPTVPLAWARDRLQARLPVQGNLDPMLLVAGGTALEEGVSAILAALGDGPLVFNLGHGVHLTTPPEHVGALVEQVRARR
jgi:uroporphyrinogen decarboxylase